MELKVICKRLIAQNLDGNITEGEYGADVVGITVSRMHGKHDLSTFSFRLTAISKLNESIAEQILSMDNIDDENIHLLWKVTSDFTSVSGEVTLILVGVNTDNTVQIKFISQSVTINDDYRLKFIESPTVLEQAYNQVQLEVQKAVDAAERAEEAASKPIIVPVATEDTVGGIVSGGDISIIENGTVTVNSVNGKIVGCSVPENAVFTDTVYTLPVASKTRLGGVKAGDDITISSDGAITVNSIGGKTVKTSVPQNAVFTDTVYTLPKATANMLGGVKVDNNSIIVNSNGVISATGFLGKHGETLNGSNSYTLSNSISYPVLELSIFGNSVQNGTPTPDKPVDIVSVGDDGLILLTVDNGGDVELTAAISSSLPLCSIGEYRDELIYNADGTGKIIKRIRKVIFDGSENWGQMNTVNKKYRYAVGIGSANLAINNENFTTMSPSLMKCDIYATIANDYIYLEQNGIAINHTKGNGSTIFIYDENWATATIDEWKAHLAENPINVIYVLNTPQEIELSATEMTTLRALQTFNGTTNIYNDEGVEMSVKIATNPILADYVKPVIDGLVTRIENLEATVFSIGGNV